ncbi:RNA polymerase sigma-70 factor (ECF subfamily) [Stackebrandtia endophytica]|uniref:RNA polymerase sigma-70 factor (ECF subfamily) n=1 Tax=Stackebrandtia endophytica TaxID=1496996 RepID=A0A543AWC7_9ACTN|nr:RNA polymerase sigma factor [Stackebrandtia endophytica]TQL76887.1 RNA polymerase sigma-70 factor (ECF subfamily) [Stackebrandtia endophytica]
MRARIRAGDPVAFRELFDGQARLVYNHGYRLTGSWSAAEEVVSLTFLEAWRLRSRLDPDEERGSLRSWLLGIATNVARNLRRAARRHDQALRRLPKPDVVPDPATEVADRVDDGERVAAVFAAMAKLRRAEREVLALCVWSELDYKEAAVALDIPVGTVRSRLSRARAKLARLAVAEGRRARRETLEPPPRPGQIPGDRICAVRPAQEIR